MQLSWATGGLYLDKSLRIYEEYLRQEALPYWVRAKIYTATLSLDKIKCHTYTRKVQSLLSLCPTQKQIRVQP